MAAVGNRQVDHQQQILLAVLHLGEELGWVEHWDEQGRHRVAVEHLDQVEQVVVEPLQAVEGAEVVDLIKWRVKCVN